MLIRIRNGKDLENKILTKHVRIADQSRQSGGSGLDQARSFQQHINHPSAPCGSLNISDTDGRSRNRRPLIDSCYATKASKQEINKQWRSENRCSQSLWRGRPRAVIHWLPWLQSSTRWCYLVHRGLSLLFSMCDLSGVTHALFSCRENMEEFRPRTCLKSFKERGKVVYKSESKQINLETWPIVNVWNYA